ncbi:MAG: DUF481 domain-containing protein [Bacteroidota bacterium]
MIKKFFFPILLVIVINANAQVLNIEHLRIVNDSTGFAGSIGINLQLIKNTKDIFIFGNTIYAQYRKKEHLIFLINNISYKKINDEDIINKGTMHLRYNYKLNDIVTLEALGQLQYNTISKIEMRQLIGGGTRFKITEKEKYKIYLGTILMHEYEKINNEPNIFNNDFRFSGYLSVRLYPTQNIIFTSTTFYQPRLDNFNDYRIYNQNSFSIKVFKKLSLQLTYIISYDTFPAEAIPKTQYELLNGLVYTFD